jgi:hypothetical protein
LYVNWHSSYWAKKYEEKDITISTCAHCMQIAKRTHYTWLYVATDALFLSWPLKKDKAKKKQKVKEREGKNLATQQMKANDDSQLGNDQPPSTNTTAV